MLKQILFLIALMATIGFFFWTMKRIFNYFALLKPAFPLKDIPKRIQLTLKVAVGQSKILRRPAIGLIHALVWWGFIVILFGSFEMIVDGLFATEEPFQSLAPFMIFLLLPAIFSVLLFCFQ